MAEKKAEKKEEKKVEKYIKSVFPKVWTLSASATSGDTEGINTGVERTLEYKNKSNEISEVKKIVLNVHPIVKVTVTKTVAGQDTTVHPETYVHDLVDKTIVFKRYAGETGEVVDKDQSLYIKLNHAIGTRIGGTIILDKDKRLYY